MSKMSKKLIKETIKREIKTEPVGFVSRIIIIGGVLFIGYGAISHGGNYVVAYKELQQLFLRGVM